jgi:hypothetical protein
MAKTRVLVVRLNVIEPLNVPDPEAALFQSLNEKGIEVLGEVPTEKYDAVLPLMVKPYKAE